MLRAIALSVVSLAFASLALANDVDNQGREFVLGFLPNPLNPPPAIELHLTSDVATMVQVEYPIVAPSFVTTVAVTPGNITVVSLPDSASNGGTAGVVTDNGVRAFSTTDDEFVCYMINRAPFTSDAGMALPVDALNTEYVVLTYQASDLVPDDRTHFVVVGAFDGSSVTITPTKALAGGFAAGVPFTVALDKGDTFLGQGVASGAAGDLIGTRITATAPVHVSNGNLCANVPSTVAFCDAIFEVAHAVQTWGQEVLVQNLPQRTQGSRYRILAAVDGTQVNLDGAPLAALNAGQFFETAPLAGGHVIDANEGIFVCQFMSGSQEAGSTEGDPAQGNMIPSAQYLSNYTFSTVGAGQFDSHYVTVIAQNADIATITLDGVAIGAGNFAPIGASGFSAAVVSIPEGTHQTASNGVHGITVEGFNQDDSYIYPGGALFEFINPPEETAPVCTLTITGQPQSATGTATDDQPNDSGVFFVELLPGAVNLTLTVDPFVPGAPSVNFAVDLTDNTVNGSGTVEITDGAGNTTTCDLFLEGAECFLLLGSGFGSAEWTNGGHTFPTLLSGVDDFHAVLLDDIPDLPVSFPVDPQGQVGPRRPFELVAQVVMWNPGVFPDNPEQFTAALQVLVWPDGRLKSRVHGAPDGMGVEVELVHGDGGQLFLRFPFSIDGL